MLLRSILATTNRMHRKLDTLRTVAGASLRFPWPWPAPQLQLQLQPAGCELTPKPTTASPLEGWLGLLLMAVPKKRTSYTRKRVRRAGQLATRGPKLQAHMNMCPVCERMRAPHRVCDREDCRTYFKHRWL